MIELKKISIQKRHLRENQAELRSTQVQISLFQNYWLDSDENLYSLLDDHKTYGKKFQVTHAVIMTSHPKQLNITIQVFISKLHA